MATINAVVTEDARVFWPKMHGGLAGIVTSSTSFSTYVVTLSTLSTGDCFIESGLLKRRLSIPSATGLTGGNSWVLTVGTGVVNQLSNGTVVTRQGGIGAAPLIRSFKIGEGGWIDLGAGKVPRIADQTLRRLDNNLQDIDAIVDSTRIGLDIRYPISSRGSFEKDLVYGTDFAFVAPTTLKVHCRLEAGEFNDDGYTNPPSLWEIGLFAEHPTMPGEQLMVAYGTFPEQIKTNVLVIENYVNIVY